VGPVVVPDPPVPVEPVPPVPPERPVEEAPEPPPVPEVNPADVPFPVGRWPLLVEPPTSLVVPFNPLP